MSALVIKTFAIVFMLIDHIGYAIGSSGFAELGFSDGYWLCRSVGRLALPIFAFLIANGFKHTRSRLKYALRLLVFAVISEVPFDLFTKGKLTLISVGGMVPDLNLDNVFFTLLIGLCYLTVNSYLKEKKYRFSPVISAAAFFVLGTAASFISADYGVVGVAWVALFGLVDACDRKNAALSIFGCAVLSYWKIIARCVLVAVYRVFRINIGSIPLLSYYFAGDLNTMSFIQPFSLVALGFIFAYNGKSGMPENKTLKAVLKYAFYIFYPLHILLLYLFVK